MINWRDLEERADLAQQEAIFAGLGARERLEIEEEQELLRQPLRRRLASALIQLGVKLDPQAAEDLVSVSVGAA